MAYTIPAIISSITSLINSLPQLIPQIIRKIQDISAAFQQNIPSEIRQQVMGYLANLMGTIGNALQSVLLSGLSAIPGSIGLVLGFASLPLFLFYLIVDAEKLTKGFYSPLPP